MSIECLMSEFKFNKLFAEITYQQKSLQDVADAIGVHRNTLYKLKTGQSIPSFDLIAKIANYLKVPIAELYEPKTSEDIQENKT